MKSVGRDNGQVRMRVCEKGKETLDSLIAPSCVSAGMGRDSNEQTCKTCKTIRKTRQDARQLMGSTIERRYPISSVPQVFTPWSKPFDLLKNPFQRGLTGSNDAAVTLQRHNASFVCIGNTCSPCFWAWVCSKCSLLRQTNRTFPIATTRLHKAEGNE